MSAYQEHTPGMSDAPPPPVRGFFLRCNSRGSVLEIVRDDLGVWPAGAVGRPLTRVVDHQCTSKAASFVRAIAEEGATLDWELGFWDGARIRVLTCMGVRGEAETVVVGAASMTDAMMVCLCHLHELDNVQTNELRRRLEAHLTRGADAGAYEELTRLNNELTNLQRDLARANAKLERLARTDPLTDAPNRRDFFEQAGAALRRAAHEKRHATVLMCDADEFKACNDRHGHDVGDQVLIEIARRLAAQMRPEDRYARFGGEEFAAFLPGCDAAAAMRVAERFRAAIAASPVATGAGGEPVRITVSVGVAVKDEATPDAACPTLAGLLNLADQALFHAKERGRDRAELWSPTPRRAA